MSRFAVILPAAGRSSRFQGKEKKPFTNLDGRAVWLRTAEQFVTRDDVAQTVLVVDPEDQEMVRRRYAPNMAFMNVQIANGGRERFESVANALKKIGPGPEFIAVHDAVRPCLTEDLINAVFAKAAETGAAMLAVPVVDTIKRVEKGIVQQTVPRQGLWLAQTPQVFRRDWLEAAYDERGKFGSAITDDAQLIEAAGHAVAIVEGIPGNIKITTRGDLALAEAILRSRPSKPKPGPIHPFAEEEMWK
jgi:2-C-methyl-D-erythritol 4-phosphate cytidylyltransferase